MIAKPTPIPGVLILEPKVFCDERGFFLETFNRTALADFGITEDFVQDNQSFSKRNVLRGLHYQIPYAQGKLVRVLSGEIFDVALDLRRKSKTFGRWFGMSLSAESKLSLWIPSGLAHGFRVLSDTAEVLYKTTDFYHPECERTILWNDANLAIDWRMGTDPILSDKDRRGTLFREAEVFED
ncbi:MAG: dTDP-4-dehydrorhamnose 3,5-epimerase [Acidobacteriaceae bacterium]